MLLCCFRKKGKKEKTHTHTHSCHVTLHLYGCPCIYSCSSSLPRQGFSPSLGHGIATALSLSLSLSLSPSQLIMGIPCAILKEKCFKWYTARIKCFRKWILLPKFPSFILGNSTHSQYVPCMCFVCHLNRSTDQGTKSTGPGKKDATFTTLHHSYIFFFLSLSNAKSVSLSPWKTFGERSRIEEI